MQAVILAAGNGVRCRPLTLTRPKPLLPIANKTILEHNLDQLSGIVSEAIIVVGYLGHLIKEKIGSSYKSIRITYIEQENQTGTGSALWLCKNILKGRFIVLNGDDLYSKEDIKRCVRHEYCILAKKVKDTRGWGIIEVQNQTVKSLEEKPKKSKSNLANTGLYVLKNSIFQYKLKKSSRGEYEATDIINHLVKENKVVCERAKQWLPIGYPWHMLDANGAVLKKKRSDIRGKIEKGVAVKGTLILGRSSIIKSGTYIEGNVIIGNNCTLGPNVHLRGPIAIGNNCKIGNGSEVKSSIIFDNSSVPHLSYIGDSIVGENVNIGGGTITANLRFDHATIKVDIEGQKIDSLRKKLGVIIGDGASLGINVSTMPGIWVWPNSRIKPGTVVYKDVKN